MKCQICARPIGDAPVDIPVCKECDKKVQSYYDHEYGEDTGRIN